MTSPPPCTRLGSQCRRLKVLLRVGSTEEGLASLDHEGTWLLGHTERIDFLDLWDDGEELYVDAHLHVACRYFREAGGQAHCTAHGFRGTAPTRPRRPAQPRRLGADRFRLVDSMMQEDVSLPVPRSLPVLAGANPCAGAPCRTADNAKGAACCRDLQVEIMCTTRQKKLEALVRSRRSPYLCKVERGGPFSIDVEMISRCDYLDPDDGVACTLHGRKRADGRPAKPDLCSEWPKDAEVTHPGCVLVGGQAGRRAGGQ